MGVCAAPGLVACFRGEYPTLEGIAMALPVALPSAIVTWMIARRLAPHPDFAPLLKVVLVTAPLVSGLLCAFLLLRRSD